MDFFSESRCKKCAMLTLLLVIIFVIGCQGAGYDSVECDPSSKSRTGRARLLSTIPCDLTKQSYCNLPGSSYPWGAVRRFVKENQGLVRRMYGDLQHKFVLETTLEEHLENEISWDELQHSADKYSKDYNLHVNQRQARVNSKFISESKNLRSNNEVLEQPHFRPTSNKSKPTKLPLQPQPVKTSANDQSESYTVLDNIIKDILDSNALSVKSLADKSENPSNIFLVSKASTKLTSVTPAVSTTTAKVKVGSNTTEENDAKITESDIKAPENLDQYVIETFGNNSIVSSTDSTTTKIPTTSERSTTQNSQEKPVKLSSTLKNNGPQDDSSLLIGEIETEIEQEEEEAIITEIFGLNDEKVQENDDAETERKRLKNSNNKKNSMETQLFQDSFQKDKEPPTPHFNRRVGVNACPVKEEVVAPFWGNNTRGEVLALLNVYPFEQYINWEKCTHEHEQMYCRDGCRCEQQYRLHRLLAYNPYDPCRGIFSDWFRFPSCCICKCYDIPFDFRVTSRSPRSQSDNDEPQQEVMTAESVFVDDNIDMYGPP